MDVKRFIIPFGVAITILTWFNWRNEQSIKMLAGNIKTVEQKVEAIEKTIKSKPDHSADIKDAADCIEYLRNTCSDLRKALHKATGKWDSK